MTTTSELFAIAEAAIAYEVARRVAAALRAQRSALRCEAADRGDTSVGDPGMAPCYLVERFVDVDYCDTCKKRQRVHCAYRAAVKTRQRLMRQFQRFALKAIDPRTIERQVRSMEQEHEGATEQDAPDDTTATSQADGHADPDPGDVNQTAPTPDGD